MTRSPTDCASGNPFATKHIELVIAPAVVTVYRVRYKRHRASGTHWTEYRRFNSLGAAVRRVAWWIIGDRYDMFHAYNPDPPLPGHLPDCCCDDGPLCTGNPWDQCPLHDREDGYFRRLHNRMSQWIEKGFMLSGAIQASTGLP